MTQERYLQAARKAPPRLPLTSVCVIIPAYNDEHTVGRLVDDTDCLLKELCEDFEILCINDGSTDSTLAVLGEKERINPRLKVINHEVNQGFGRTIKELYLSGSKELVFSLPGDYQYAPKEIIPMADGLRNHDLVIGRRIKRNDPPRRRLQSLTYNALLRTVYGVGFTDVNSIKLFKREILDHINLESDTAFVDAELVIRTVQAGFRVVEVPIEHRARETQGAGGGKISMILETFSDLLMMRHKL